MKNNQLLLLTLAVAVFAVITTEMGVIGLMPQLMEQLHVSATDVGMLVSVYAIVVAVAGPFITLLLSGWNKKTVLLIIAAFFVTSNLFSAFTGSYSTMMVFRIVPAIVHAVFFAVALVVAANSVRPLSFRMLASAYARSSTGATGGFSVFMLYPFILC